MEKNIINFENYTIDENGLVKNSKSGRILKQKLTNMGYYLVCLSKNNKKYFKLTHRLVAEAFIPNPENKPCIDHINTIRIDNRVENLRWVSHRENSNNPDTIKHIKNNNTQKIPIQQIDKNGNLVAEYESIGEAARINNFSQGNIHRCLNGGYYRKDRKGGTWQKVITYKGFKWKYKMGC